MGWAKTEMTRDPAAARVLIDAAHAETKLAVAELRDLARGIHPAVLGDRGLDAALSSLAAKSDVPVDIRVDLGDQRPPAAVEGIAYATVAEALTNVASYSRATTTSVGVWRDGDYVIVEIVDNGVGGAQSRAGGGLTRLADRAATIDGVVTVVSPVGGPTVVRAQLPSDW